MVASRGKNRGPARQKPTALAVAAHPDDIEFYMAGTLLLLQEAGFEIHYLNVSSGSCGSMEMSRARTRAVRRLEAMRAAETLGAVYHSSFADDLEIVYDLTLLRKLAAIVRLVRPAVLLTHSPQDYMEDHVNTCRLAVTAAFARGMPNFRTDPRRRAINQDVTVYHAMPHGLRDPLGKKIAPEAIVNTAQAHQRKCEALAAHATQKNWLDVTQGMGSYLRTMTEFSRAVGKMGGFDHGEGWRRHLHWGFCAEEADPLREFLGDDYRKNRRYEK